MPEVKITVPDYMDDEYDRGTLEISISPEFGMGCVMNIHQHGFRVMDEFQCHCDIPKKHMVCEDCPTETNDEEESTVYNYIGLKFKTQRDAVDFLKKITKELEDQL